MNENELKELLLLVKDNNKMLRDIWTFLYRENSNNDLKDFIINVMANQFGR